MTLQNSIMSNREKPKITSTKLLVRLSWFRLDWPLNKWQMLLVLFHLKPGHCSRRSSTVTEALGLQHHDFFYWKYFEINFKLASFVKHKQLKLANLLFRWKWNMCTFVVTVPAEIKQFSIELFIVQYYNLQYELCQHSERKIQRTFLSVPF